MHQVPLKGHNAIHCKRKLGTTNPKIQITHQTAKWKNEQPHTLPKQTGSQTSETETWETDEFVKHGVYLAGLNWTLHNGWWQTELALLYVTGQEAGVEALRKLRSSGPCEGD